MVEALLRGLDGFDRRSLREGAAALALWPSNADRHAALQMLVDALAAAPDLGGDEITSEGWEAWLGSEDARPLQEVLPDGLHDAPLVFEAALNGTRQQLLGGRLEYPDLHYRLWMDALKGASDPSLQAAERLLTVAIATGNLVIERAGLETSQIPEHQPSRQIAAPPQQEYERLCSAVRFELAHPADTAPLLQPLCRQGAGELWRPLSQEAEDLVLVADPWHFSLSALVRAMGLAARSPELPAVLRRVRRGVREVVITAVEEMDWALEQVEEDHILAIADVGHRVLIGFGALSPDSEQVGAEALSAEAELVEMYERVSSLARITGAKQSLLSLISDGREVTISPAHPAFHVSDDAAPWYSSVGDLQVMGAALRKDPLALPVALNSALRPPWPPNFDLLDIVGSIRQREEGWRQKPRESIDGTEHMLMRAKMMAARHTVPAPDLTRELEVSRWDGIEDPAIFCSRDLDQFALCVRGAGRYLWVTCPGALERRYELLPVIATTFAFWLAQLLKAGFLLAAAARLERVFARFDLELDQRLGPQLTLSPAKEGNRNRLVVGPGFVDALCRGDNGADRMLVGAVLTWAQEWEHPELKHDLDAVIPPGRGTAVIWPEPSATTNPPRLEPPPLVESRARMEIELALASRAVAEGEMAVISGPDLEPGLEALARSLEAMLQANGELLEPSALRDLVALHERAAFQSHTEAIFLPARNEMRGAVADPRPAEEILSRDLALRVLVERFSALPPRGSRPLSMAVANGLRAATELQFELRGALDVVHWEKAGGSVVVTSEHGVVLDLEGSLPAAAEAMREQVTAAAPDWMAQAHQEWWGGEPEVAPTLPVNVPRELKGHWRELDLAMSEEWTVSFEQMIRLLQALSDAADGEPDCVASAPVEDLRRVLEKRTAIEGEVVEAAIERLTLGPYPEYDTFSEEHQPGRANRARSYMRRPLVSLPRGKLCWSSLHCRRAAEYLINLVESGRLQGSRRITKSVTRISQDLDQEFEKVVLERTTGCGWQGELRVTHLAGKPLQRKRGEPLGDIDVLAWSRERQQVWLLDAKRMIPGVEPGPMLREGESFVEYVQKHRARLEWVLRHLPELAREIGVEDLSSWEVKAALVIDRPLTGAHLGQLEMPIWTHWSLPQELGEG